MKQVKSNLIMSGILILTLYSCFWNNCPPSRIIGEVYLMTNPNEYIPDENQLFYYSDNDTLRFYSKGLQVFDSIMDLTVFCQREDMIEGYLKSWNQAKTKIYIKKYLSSDKRFSLEYELSLYSFIARTDGMPWSDTISEEDTVLYDVLYINYRDNKEGVAKDLRWATSLRSNPGLSYNLEQVQYFDTLSVDNFRFENVYADKYIIEYSKCDTSDGQRFLNIPCFMIYRKIDGVIAMKSYKGWYFLHSGKL